LWREIIATSLVNIGVKQSSREQHGTANP